MHAFSGHVDAVQNTGFPRHGGGGGGGGGQAVEQGAELGALSVGRVVEEDGWSTDVRVGVLVRSGQSRFDFLDLSSLTFMQPLWLEFQPLDPHLVRSSLCRSSLFSRAVTEAILESWSRVNLHCDDENGELDSRTGSRTGFANRFAQVREPGFATSLLWVRHFSAPGSPPVPGSESSSVGSLPPANLQPFWLKVRT